MALYLGNEKIKITLNGSLFYLNLYSSTPITNGIRLLSSDNYILQDSNGVYLIPSDYVEVVVDNVISSSEGIYLTIKESK